MKLGDTTNLPAPPSWEGIEKGYRKRYEFVKGKAIVKEGLLTMAQLWCGEDFHTDNHGYRRVGICKGRSNVRVSPPACLVLALWHLEQLC